MTSPVGGKPESTQDRYDDVHSIGSSFGAELDENAVRKLLGNQVENPFGSIVTGLAGTVVGILESVANGILGIFKPGATEGGIRDAIVAVMEPIESQVYDLGANLTALSDETKLIIGEQKVLVDEATAALEIVKTTLAEQATKNEEFQSELTTARTETSNAVKKSSEAIALANSINTTLTAQITSAFNQAIAKAEEGISKAETANSELISMNTSLGELTAQASALNTQLSAQNTKFTNGLAAANTAIGEAKDAAAAVKVIADQNKKDVATAISKADAANADLAVLTPKVTDAVSKANKASSDVSTLTPKVTSASADAAKASQDVAALSPKVTDAVSKSEKATSDVAALTPKVTAAQSKADSAFTEAGKVRNEVAPKIEAAQTKGETALAVADKAVDWLRNPNEIGASLIAIDPETGKPNWAERLDTVTAEENPLNLPNAYKAEGYSSRTPRGMAVNVDPSTEYVVSLWVKADQPGSQMTYDIRNQNGDLAFATARSVDGFPHAGDVGRAFWIRDVPTEWTQYKKVVTPKESTRTARFGTTYFNHSSGDTREAVQYIADLQIYPLVPSQLDVDQAQNDAIRANQDILRQQQEINAQQDKFNTFQTQFNKDQVAWNQASSDATQALQEVAKAQEDINAEQQKFNLFQTEFNEKQTTWNNAVDLSLANQKVLNDNVSDWTKGAETAISANTSAIKALGKIDTGESLIAYLTPTDEEVRAGTAKYDVPVWTTAAHREFSGQNPPPSHVKHAFGASSTDGTKTAKTVPVAVRPGTKYILSFWAYGSGNLVVYMYGNGGGFPVRSTRQLMVDQDSLSIMKDSRGRRRYNPDKNGNSSNSNGTQWLLSGFKPDELYKWVHYKFEVEFTEPTTEVWFNSFYWNWRTPSTYGQYLADMQFYPDVPTQADVDEAQNKAIQVNKDLLVEQARINVEQERINDLRTEFEVEQKKINDAQTGINALNSKTDESLLQGLKALGKKSLGTSLIPYKTPSDQEVRDYNDGKLDYNPYDDPEYFAAGSSVAGNDVYGRYVRVYASQGTQAFEGELVKVDSSVDYKVRFKAYANTEGSILVVHMKDQNGGSAIQQGTVNDSGVLKSTSYIIDYITLKKGWASYEGKIRFKPETTHAALGTFYWNHPTGVGATQGLTQLEVVPDVPTQDDLNQSFQDNFERVDNELGLIKSTDQEWKDSQQGINDALTAATEANTAFSRQQKNLNDLFQEQLWAQLDMIEQLELQSPRVYHQNVDDGPLISKIPSWVGWSSAREYKNTFINFYHRHSDTKMVAWQATGKWEGQVRVTMTWSNGATDVWVYTVYKDRIVRGDSSWTGRTFFNSGGAALVYHKNTTFEVYPKHLGRWFNLYWKPEESSWYTSATDLDRRGVEGAPSIVRWDGANSSVNPGLRLSASFTCDQPLTLVDMTGKEITYQPGEVINPQIIDVNKLDKTKRYRFEEVGIHW